MNAKHTPGPWKVAEHHGAIDVMGVGSGICRVFTDPNQNSRPTMPEARANARAIAAVPAMIGALRDLVEDFGAMTGGSESLDVARAILKHIDGGA